MQFNPADFPVLGDDNQHNGVKVVQQPKLIVQQQVQPQQQKVKKVTIQSTTSHNKYITIITGLSKFYNMDQYENMCKQFRRKLACAANIDNKDIIVHGDFCLELGDYFKNQGVNIDVKNKFNRKQMMNIKWDQV